MKEMIKRIEEGKCFVCNKELTKQTETRTVKYKGKDARVCISHHHVD